MKKIHFINRIDNSNTGDWTCSPLNYFFDYFDQFNIIRHDIEFVNFNEINSNDIVILGASGMFNVLEKFNININKILNICNNVISWSIGFNTHNNIYYIGNITTKINFEKFKVITIRDYQHPSGFDFLPDPTCLSEELLKNIPIKRYIGLIEHKSLPIICDDLDLMNNKISNSHSFREITEYISSSEVVVTNSYHIAYWTMLMNKKSIVIDKFSTKFDYFKYKPTFITSSIINNKRILEIKQIKKYIQDAKTYNDILEESISMNISFFDKIKNIIEDSGIQKNKSYQNLYELNLQSRYDYLYTINNIPIIENNIKNIEHKIRILNDDLNFIFKAKKSLLFRFIKKLKNYILKSLNK